MVKLESSITPWPDTEMEKFQWLDEYLVKQPATEKEFNSSWQAYKYMVRGKMYAYIGVNDKSNRPIITLKLDPSDSDVLRRMYEDIVPGYYMNKVNWSTVYLDGEVPKDVIMDMVVSSHNVLVSSLSKKVQREIMGE